MSKVYTSADQLIGKTPLLELTHLEKSLGLEAKLVAKLEYFNPAQVSVLHPLQLLKDIVLLSQCLRR